MTGDTGSRREMVTARLRAAGCVYAEDEAQLLLATAASSAELASMLSRRLKGEPLEHVLGWAEFCGLKVAVDPGVFVPRRRTELLVREAVALLPPARTSAAAPVVVDVCCGSGAIGAALLSSRPDIQLHATDVDAVAVGCARRNLASSGGRVYEGDLFEPLPPDIQGTVSIVAANAPYVPTEAVPLMPPEARDHEPRTALDGGPDGLDIQRRVVSGAPRWLSRGGYLLLETSRQQSQDTLQSFERAGLRAHLVHCDELDATAVVGERL